MPRAALTWNDANKKDQVSCRDAQPLSSFFKFAYAYRGTARVECLAHSATRRKPVLT